MSDIDIDELVAKHFPCAEKPGCDFDLHDIGCLATVTTRATALARAVAAEALRASA